ncbi:MAG: non-homologous end-joining DNA ligase [Eubacteriales bacterium]|nr:non-homologous end-joining DNA ligase [Eubacteriales bacterium]MDD3073093.1 non-homologous end-joining DNA ligase [Eubacteriales bacterium]MDD4078898.1 non-homologous end-joining DNA ligase [Eubacteriales bacterium]MDD4768408.1 non-homologous end-joining DNA ligase [Eubacteriales bacterium]
MHYLDIQGKQVRISNPDKVFWPQTGTTKGQMLEYYIKISPWLLPCLKGRLISLQRFPHGVRGRGFYQKNCPDNAPEWVKTYSLQGKSGKETRYVLIEDLPTLIWLVNLGVIEFHPWLSSVVSLDYPDYAVFDLDPMERYGIDEVRQVAQGIGELLQKLGLTGQVKTSGATGMQVFVPLAPIYSYQQVRDFVHACCQIIHKGFSQWTTLERSIANRQGKIYLDYMQNARGQTIVSAYSLRPQPIPSLSFPLDWEDLRRPIDPGDYSLHTLSKTSIFPAWAEKTPGQRLEKAAEVIKNMLY